MHVIRRLAFALGITVAAGCAAPVPHVVRGEAFATGHTNYDDFFVAVRELRGETEAAPGDEEASHAGLIKALALEPKARTALAVEESGARAKKLVERGVLLHLEIAPEARLVAAKGKVELGPDGDALLKSFEDAAKSSLEMRKRFAAVAARAAELEKRRGDLRGQALADFRGEPQAKRDEVIAELDAAQGVIADALGKANASAGAASRFVVELAQAVETGATEAPPAKHGKGAPPKRPPVVQPAAPPAAIASAPAAAPPKPAPPKPAAAAAPPPAKKKPKGGGDDFEP